MKRFYLIVNMVLPAVIVLLAWANWRYAAPAEDKAVGKIPQLPVIKTGSAAGTALMPQDIVFMAEHNAFAPGRGREEEGDDKAVATPGRPVLLLLGICRIGAAAGAIITDKNGSRPAATRPPPPMLPAAMARPGAPGSASRPMPRQPTPVKTARKPSAGKRYFKLGDTVRDGYVLKEVKTDAVVLVRGQDRMELKLQRSGRFGNIETGAAQIRPPRTGAPEVSQARVLQHFDTMMQTKQVR